MKDNFSLVLIVALQCLLSTLSISLSVTSICVCDFLSLSGLETKHILCASCSTQEQNISFWCQPSIVCVCQMHLSPSCIQRLFPVFSLLLGNTPTHTRYKWMGTGYVLWKYQLMISLLFIGLILRPWLIAMHVCTVFMRISTMANTQHGSTCLNSRNIAIDLTLTFYWPNA